MSKNVLIEDAAAKDLADGLESNLTLCELPMSGMATCIRPGTRTRIAELLQENQRYRQLLDQVHHIHARHDSIETTMNVIEELDKQDQAPLQLSENTAVDAHGNSLLHYAAMKNGTSVAMHHIEHDRVNIDVRNNLGYPALYYALERGNLDLSRQLIQRGCSIQRFPRTVHAELIQAYASLRVDSSISRSIVAAIRADAGATTLRGVKDSPY